MSCFFLRPARCSFVTISSDGTKDVPLAVNTERISTNSGTLSEFSSSASSAATTSALHAAAPSWASPQTRRRQWQSVAPTCRRRGPRPASAARPRRCALSPGCGWVRLARCRSVTLISCAGSCMCTVRCSGSPAIGRWIFGRPSMALSAPSAFRTGWLRSWPSVREFRPGTDPDRWLFPGGRDPADPCGHGVP